MATTAALSFSLSRLHARLSLRSSVSDAAVPAPAAAVVVRQGKGVVRFRPCIDIHKGKVKQIVGSTLRDLPPHDDEDSGTAAAAPLITNFESERSAGEFAEMYKNDGLHGGHVIMLGADPASHSAALEALAAFPGGLQVGGGVNLENAKLFLSAGASHVIVTSFVFKDGKMDAERLKQLVDLIGKERLVLDLSCRKKDGHYMVVTDRWQRFSDLALNEATLAMLATSADEFLVHGVDVEGMRLGIDDELVSILGKWSPFIVDHSSLHKANPSSLLLKSSKTVGLKDVFYSTAKIPVTYAGGVNTLADLERIKNAGFGGVDFTVGSALDIFGGDLQYRDVVSWHNQQLVATQ